MKRTSKAERKTNAKTFWSSLQNGGQRAAIVIERNPSTSNPYVNRKQFVAVCSFLKDDPIVIAEDATEGIRGCFYDLIDSIFDIDVTEQIDYFDDKFADWLKKKCHMRIAYNDGYVMMVEYAA